MKQDIDAINLIDILEHKFEKDQAKVIARAIDEAIGENVKQQPTILATKEDLANVKVELIKWMFVFWLGTVGSFIAVARLLLS